MRHCLGDGATPWSAGAGTEAARLALDAMRSRSQRGEANCMALDTNRHAVLIRCRQRSGGMCMDQQPEIPGRFGGVERQYDETFNVVVVCRANHCRSPLMEFLLRQQASLRNLNWIVSSAGTEARPGDLLHPYAAELLADQGIDTSGWISRKLDEGVLMDAHLVLTATQAEREIVEGLRPDLIGSTFPLLQLAYLARSTSSGRRLAAAELGPWLLQESYRRRKRIAHLPAVHRDLDDPMGRPRIRFRQCAQLINAAYADILAVGPPVRWG